MDRGAPLPPVMSSSGRRGLFPEVEPHEQGWLPASGGHEIFYEVVGAKAGKPAVVLHGGPGGAINPTMRRVFDPHKRRTAPFAQRGRECQPG